MGGKSRHFPWKPTLGVMHLQTQYVRTETKLLGLPEQKHELNHKNNFPAESVRNRLKRDRQNADFLWKLTPLPHRKLINIPKDTIENTANSRCVQRHRKSWNSNKAQPASFQAYCTYQINFVLHFSGNEPKVPPNIRSDDLKRLNTHRCTKLHTFASILGSCFRSGMQRVNVSSQGL
jgi:hypothetical protein